MPSKKIQQISLTTWTAIAVLIAGALGAGVLGLRHRPARPSGYANVVVATGALPAFSAVTAADIRIEKVSLAAVPAGAAHSPGAVRGHYLLRQLGAGQVVVGGAVGPAVRPGMVVLPLPVDDDSSALVQAGTSVDVLLAPTGQAGTAVVLRRVLVIDRRTAAGGRVVAFLAVPRDSEQAIGEIAGRGLVILARAPGGT